MNPRRTTTNLPYIAATILQMTICYNTVESSSTIVPVQIRHRYLRNSTSCLFSWLYSPVCWPTLQAKGVCPTRKINFKYNGYIKAFPSIENIGHLSP